MIEDPPLLRFASGMRRPEAQQLSALAGVATSHAVDCMGGRGALDWRITSIGPVRPMIGVALTCWCGPADNLALCAAIAGCQPGDVIFAATDGFTGCAVAGDLLLGIAKNRGAAGFITDGLVRDVLDIQALGLACFAQGSTPNSPVRNGPGTVGMPIQCGGLGIASGDIILADQDGIVVVPLDLADTVIDRLKQVRASEAELSARIRAGLTEVDFVPAIPAARRGGRPVA